MTESRGPVSMDDIFQIEDEDGAPGNSSTLCLIGKVQTMKNFNTFGLLETMRRAMNPPMGFTACKIGKNLFSFQFCSSQDMKEVLSREPWLFDKYIMSLKELGRGEQPSTVCFDSTPFGYGSMTYL
ncbi:hypothetical protein ACS0TY_018513 [Phlomoides rotata]